MEKKTDLRKYPPHMQNDYRVRNKNIDDGKELCERCGGTGNEFMSMYKKCKDCGGSGINR